LLSAVDLREIIPSSLPGRYLSSKLWKPRSAAGRELASTHTVRICAQSVWLQCPGSSTASQCLPFSGHCSSPSESSLLWKVTWHYLPTALSGISCDVIQHLNAPCFYSSPVNIPSSLK
jgi:hypothetical protein